MRRDHVDLSAVDRDGFSREELEPRGLHPAGLDELERPPARDHVAVLLGGAPRTPPKKVVSPTRFRSGRSGSATSSPTSWRSTNVGLLGGDAGHDLAPALLGRAPDRLGAPGEDEHVGERTTEGVIASVGLAVDFGIMWMVRAGRGGENIDDFINREVVAFDGALLGKLSPAVTKDELLKLYAEKYPSEKEGSRASWASQLLRLITEAKVGDEVVCSDRDRRRYILGKITSEYEWLPDEDGRNPHVRRVKWTHEVARDSLSAATRNTLGSVLTVFKVNPDAAKDLLTFAVPMGTLTPAVVKPKDQEKNAEALGLITEETFAKAGEFIEDQIDALGWEEMQELVAGILRAMNYRTTVSEPGPDRGVDVFASPDGLGLEEPRIFVEVKHRNQQIGSKEIRAFVGGRKKGDKCLYVSTGGFSKDAFYEAERADVAITLITLPRLRKLVVEFYDKLDAETRAMVPLRRLYWPAGNVSG